jgi:hypothetical protein
MDDLVRAYLGEKIKQTNILNQNGANLVYLHGKDIGRKLGLSENDLEGITPFPASTKIVIDDSDKESETSNTQRESDEKTVETTKKPWTHRILPWVLSGAIGLGAGAGVMSLMPDKKPVEQPPTVESPELDPNVGLTIRGQKYNE